MTWYDRIQQAKVRGNFTDRDMLISGSWESCAVGERMGSILDMDMRDPMYDELVRLGGSFCEAIITHKINKAE